MSSLSLSWLWGRSIRWQLIGGVALLHTVLMTVFVIGLVRWQWSLLLEKARTQIESEAATLAAGGSDAAQARDIPALAELVNALSRDDSIRCAMVTDAQGHRLAISQLKTNVAPPTEQQASAWLAGREQAGIVNETGDTQLATAPIIAQGRTIAWAWIERDVSADRARLNTIVLAGLIYTLLSACTGTVLAAFLAGTILRPLQLLQEGVARIAQNQLDKPIPITSSNEVGDVSTAFNLAMQRLGQQQKQIGDEMAARERMQKEAEQSNQAKDQFLAVLSHELRTPLTPILTLAQMLERDPSLSAPVQEDIATIRRNVELEARLIDDLLDLTRITRGKVEMHFGNVDVHQTLREVVRLCRGDADAKKQQLSLDLLADQAIVCGDSARLQQIFWNILRNAVKFTPVGGHVAIRTQLNPHVASTPPAECAADGLDPQRDILVEISDSGIGMEPATIGRVFDAFEQGSREVTRAFGGLGLGLTISRALVDLHGGKLIATSEGRDRGSTFSIRLPLGTVAQQPAPPSTASPQQHILLVEDHVDTSQATARLLRECGYQVKIAQTIATAIQLTRKEHFDLILSDIGLPDGTGHQLIRQLVIEAPRHHVKGIAMSGNSGAENVRKSHEAGFMEHLVKPVDPRILIEAIDHAIHEPDPPAPT